MRDGEALPRPPAVAIVIPAWRQPLLLAEAIDSALAQQDEAVVVVVVDDGCPDPETAAVARGFVLADPRVHYLRQANAGLSAARNAGIDFVLAQFPGVEAIQFLDADNRLTPHAVATGMARLRATPGLGWVYPQFDKFGIGDNASADGAYSRLLHVAWDNLCEAGSLVARRVFAAGLRFDPGMRSGYEDWDFWLQALAQGFTGACNPQSGLEYRQRGGSMVRGSNRERAAILAGMRRKHAALFTPARLLAWEHDEAPRFAALAPEGGPVALFTDPAAPVRAVDRAGYLKLFQAWRAAPDLVAAPPFLLCLGVREQAALRRLGLLHGLLWLAERATAEVPFVALRLEHDARQVRVSVRRIGPEAPLLPQPAGWLATARILADCAEDPRPDWIGSLREAAPAPLVEEITLGAPFALEELQEAGASATGALLGLDAELRAWRARAGPPRRWLWRGATLPDRGQSHLLLREALGTGPVHPAIPDPAGPPRIGFVLPLVATGGVERVAGCLAEALRGAGCQPHLFVLGPAAAERVPGQEELFETVNFLAADYPLGDGPRRFAGHGFPLDGDAAARAPELLGLLGGMDAVLLSHVAPANALLGPLRARGIRTIGHLHVLDRSPLGRACGHPYLALAFEHDHDLLLGCSRQMLDWLHGMGVPAAKLRLVPNAPGHRIAEADRLAALAARARRGDGRGDGPLRALVLGRLDPQKGIERVLAAAAALRREGVAVDWRVAGREVLGAGGGWTARFAAAGVAVEPPALGGRALDALYAWADVLVLPSRWEGAPLTVLEAQRLGCVPIATRVGAVEELVGDGADGLLLPAAEGAVVPALVAALRGLAADRARLRRLSAGAAARLAGAGWDRSAAPLVEALAGWFPGRMSLA